MQNISQEIFLGNSPPEIQINLFLERFDRNNYNFQHIQIGKILSKVLGGDCESGINQFLKEVIKKFYRTYEDELNQDGITPEMLGIPKTNKHGRKSDRQNSPWKVVYNWLWEYKYPRWLQDYLWDELKNKAQVNSNWMKFNFLSPDFNSRGMKVPKPIKATIPINTPLNLELALHTPDRYLYLFNRGKDNLGNITKYLVSPSQAFAPNCHLVDNINLIPQSEAMCKEVGIQFDAIGTEEYLGIVVDEPLNLPWLIPSSSEPAFEWQGKHLEELWQELEDKSWKVFYQDFQVKQL